MKKASDVNERDEARNLSNQGAACLRLFEELVSEYLRRLQAAGRLDTGAAGRFTFFLPPQAVELLQRARDHYLAALRLMPKEEAGNLAVLHHQLGGIYKHLDEAERAEYHLGEAIRLHAAVGDGFRCGQSHHDLAETMVHRGRRYAQALTHARAALELFQQAGSGAAREAHRTARLVAELESYLS
ncbi:hypothetical protein StrepF001_42285 [Streptomyces sp. F001]|uniref:hypothetical protein n=1 Tax=Streptomyces sp. F001 TaxID=1510026 RepID=UPI00101E526D|nr:hypothetical protein [Streptomyces sp. F001]RZB13775.1 hypothetical protein StrepF001_42285 [Streptomyces sp. F001]